MSRAVTRSSTRRHAEERVTPEENDGSTNLGPKFQNESLGLSIVPKHSTSLTNNNPEGSSQYYDNDQQHQLYNQSHQQSQFLTTTSITTTMTKQPTGFYSQFFNSRLNISPKRTALSIIITPCGNNFQYNPALGVKYKRDKRLGFGHVEQLTFPSAVPPGTLYKLKTSNELTQTTYDSMGNSFYCEIVQMKPALDTKPYKIDIDSLLSLEWEGKPMVIDENGPVEPKKRAPRQRRNSLDLTAHRLQQLRSGVSEDNSGADPQQQEGEDGEGSDYDGQDENDNDGQSDGNLNTTNNFDNNNAQHEDHTTTLSTISNSTPHTQNTLFSHTNKITDDTPPQSFPVPSPSSLLQFPSQPRTLDDVLNNTSNHKKNDNNPSQQILSQPTNDNEDINHKANNSVNPEQSITGPMTRRRRTYMINNGINPSPTLTATSTVNLRRKSTVNKDNNNSDTIITSNDSTNNQLEKESNEIFPPLPTSQPQPNPTPSSLSSLFGDDLKPMPMRTNSTVQASTLSTTTHVQSFNAIMPKSTGPTATPTKSKPFKNHHIDTSEPTAPLSLSAPSSNDDDILIKYNELKDKMSEKDEKVNRLEGNITSLQNQLQDQMLTSENQITTLSTTITTLTTQKETLESELTTMRSIVQQPAAPQPIQQSHGISAELQQQHDEEVAELEGQLETMKQSCRSKSCRGALLVSKDLAKKDKLIALNTNHIKEFGIKVGELSNELESTRLQNGELSGKNQSLEKSHLLLESTIATLQRQLEEAQLEARDNSNRKAQGLESNNNNNQDNEKDLQIKQLLDQVSKLQSSVKDKDSLIQSQQRELLSLRPAQQRLDEQIKLLSSRDGQIGVLEQTLSRYQGDLENSSNEIDSLQQQIELLEEDHEVIVKNLRIELDEVVLTKNNEVKELKKEMQIEREENQKDFLTSSRTVQKLYDQIEVLETQVTSVSGQLATKCDRNDYDNVVHKWKCGMEMFNQLDGFASMSCVIIDGQPTDTSNEHNCRVVLTNSIESNSDKISTMQVVHKKQSVSLLAPENSTLLSAAAKNEQTSVDFDFVVDECNNDVIENMIDIATIGSNTAFFMSSLNGLYKDGDDNVEDLHFTSALSLPTTAFISNTINQLFSTIELNNKYINNLTNNNTDVPQPNHSTYIQMSIYEVYMERLRDLIGFVPMSQLEELIKDDNQVLTQTTNIQSIQITNTTYGKNYDPNDCRILNTALPGQTTTSSRNTNTSVNIDGKRVLITTPENAKKLLTTALGYRMTNADGNRSSHIIIQLHLVEEQQHQQELTTSFKSLKASQPFVKSTISLVDLAHGFPLNPNPSPASYQEMQCITSSITALTTIIGQLIDQERQEQSTSSLNNHENHTTPLINYRLSKLTMLLKDTLSIHDNVNNKALKSKICTLFNFASNPTSFYEAKHLFKIAQRFRNTISPVSTPMATLSPQQVAITTSIGATPNQQEPQQETREIQQEEDVQKQSSSKAHPPSTSRTTAPAPALQRLPSTLSNAPTQSSIGTKSSIPPTTTTTVSKTTMTTKPPITTSTIPSTRVPSTTASRSAGLASSTTSATASSNVTAQRRIGTAGVGSTIRPGIGK